MPLYLDELALSVARCNELERADDLTQGGNGHPCRKIVNSQDAFDGPFQVPEAWAGNLASARIAFLSSNPAISAANPASKWRAKRVAEKYPTVEWPDSRIADFMINRFIPEHGWVLDRRHRKMETIDGPAWGTPEPYWGWVAKETSALLGSDAPWYEQAVMTEVVHCKSNGEEGVAEAAPLCASRHMDRILAASPADLIVVVGGKAAQTLGLVYPEVFQSRPLFGKYTEFGLPYPEQNLIRMVLGGRNRLVCFLKHPSSHGAKPSLALSYPDDVDRLRLAAEGSV
ncbi:hypothetical protein NG702_05605 [Pseudarthrobacter sp. MDT3-28]|uniref:hypothetical protein n=1 Tax=Pseudarthrobacter raffinosi TaxID=2953651 RepID=UPI00208F84F4|nr:hypothetical protein [Pseudarthrobacter sp. MDT3-28]MCO4236903.1 hypothetical protein [Pseudarthrobacter sp. MDT3-28]